VQVAPHVSLQPVQGKSRLPACFRQHAPGQLPSYLAKMAGRPLGEIQSKVGIDLGRAQGPREHEEPARPWQNSHDRDARARQWRGDSAGSDERGSSGGLLHLMDQDAVHVGYRVAAGQRGARVAQRYAGRAGEIERQQAADARRIQSRDRLVHNQIAVEARQEARAAKIQRVAPRGAPMPPTRAIRQFNGARDGPVGRPF
jgi:hypothetical protein